MTEPLPCPFCGSVPTDHVSGSTRGFYVACGCTAEGPSSYSSLEEAQAMWNTRSEGASQCGLVGLYFTTFVLFRDIPTRNEALWGVVEQQLDDAAFLVKCLGAERTFPVLVPYRSVLLLEHMGLYHFFETEDEARSFFEQVQGLIRAMAPSPASGEMPS